MTIKETVSNGIEEIHQSILQANLWFFVGIVLTVFAVAIIAFIISLYKIEKDGGRFKELSSHLREIRDEMAAIKGLITADSAAIGAIRIIKDTLKPEEK